ncbi:MAG: serine/threonine protein kinase [Myxococcota bacterium]
MTDRDDQFFGLTPDHVLQAVEALGFRTTGHIMALHCLENRVYDLKLEDQRHVVVKFYRPHRWSEAQIQEEHDFLFDLLEGEIPACAPVRDRTGRSVHQSGDIHFAIWPRTGGRCPDELSREELEVLGRLLARIHNSAEARKMVARPWLTSMRFIDESVALLEERGFLPPQHASRFKEAAETIGDIYDELSEGVPFHRIHGDCHLGNLLRGREGWFFLDFDDSLVGPAVQDLWLMIGDRGEVGDRRIDGFLEGYRQFRAFEPGWLRLVEPLRGLRMVSFTGWIARRWKDPAFPGVFPEFNSEAYWDSETRELTEQMRRCEAAA